MMFTEAQLIRLRNLGCTVDEETPFETASDRDAAFKKLERETIRQSRVAIRSMRDDGAPHYVSGLAHELSEFLRARGFLEVSTPIIIPAAFLDRMTIGSDHALRDQVFWVNGKACLRPMLAPGLYDISKRLINVLGKPLGVFEIGPCFRRESQGRNHLENFTMCNFVTWGLDEDGKRAHLEGITAELMAHLSIDGFRFESEESTVYGHTVDVMVGELELASGAFGPHPLDEAWGYEGTWAGLGMGLERLACVRYGIDSIQRVGRSLSCLNGYSLNFK